jgi:diacylglycerol kinase family enzyme
VVNGIGEHSSAVACLPGGRTNVFHRLLGMPLNLSAATQILAAAASGPRRFRSVDVGVLNGRTFIASAGVGIDGSVARWATRNRLHVRGRSHWHYLWGAVRTFCSSYAREPPSLLLHADQGAHHGVSVFVQNGPHYTYFGNRAVELVSGGTLEDRQLAGALLHRARLRDVPSILGRVFSPTHGVGEHAQVHTFPCCTRMVIRSEDARPFATAVDGEFAGEVTQATISLRPRPLSVLSPLRSPVPSRPRTH